MKILVGNDWKSTAVGYAGSVQVFAGSLTAIFAGLAQQHQSQWWIWAGLSALVLFVASIIRIRLGVVQNYVQSDPNIVPLVSPAVVDVQTYGPTPDAPVYVKDNTTTIK